MREALDKGTTYYIVKPFDCGELLNKVAFALGESQRLTSTS